MRLLNKENVLGAFTIGVGIGGLLTKHLGPKVNSYAIIGLVGLYVIYDIIEIRNKDDESLDSGDARSDE